MEKIGLPDWVILLLKGLLSNLAVIPSMARSAGIMIFIFQGVKQGCQLSPLIFILIIDPIIFSSLRQVI